MCGITGVYAMGGRPVERDLLKAMADKLVHRGPDDEGYYLDGELGFGFRRLSIIDLAHGNQPHFNEDKSLVSVCNGEIYNYRELKEELTAKGHTFATACDVEVLVHLYEEHGPAFLQRLNGQFALAIYDRRKKTLFLARDQVGIAPLFYTVANGAFIFGSEIKAILVHPEVRREVELTGLDQIFTFPGLVSPYTMFKDIHSLKPGHYLLVGPGKVEEREYWDLVYPLENESESAKAESYYSETLDELLRRAVSSRLQADVPVGFYLSGGLDSSLIAAMINSCRPDEKFHSFSIGFTQEEIDERKYQKLMTERLNSIHHEILFDWPDIGTRLQDAIYHAESPLKESYDTCSLALSEMVRQNGIKVVLTGEGSDELFGGYVGYRFDSLRQNQDEEDDYVEAQLEGQIRQKFWGDDRFLYERNFYKFRETKEALYAEGIRGSLPEFASEEKALINQSRFNGRHPGHKRSYADFKLRLADHLLADHGDRVSLANSVEARYPFLDINVIEFARTIPINLLLKDGVEKSIVKKVAAKYLPAQVIDREKFGFVAPGSPFLLKHNREWINDLLSFEKIKREGYFNPETIERLKVLYSDEKFSLNQTFDNDLLMIVLTFEIFLELFHLPDRA
ncbi:MAG: asparagine synthase (glutamine-hydrolyzing) [Proteobacteria bacterium]|nr:asparagine synthase (glutamine-hydrolyzing) [Pseudomonadota bacterium]MBU1714997.1 asparagine synthase (glutamine-hydrolyzing) [Pseudomonadota bacterium]